MSPPRAILFANGLLPDLEAARQIPQTGDLLICADGGAHNARALGLTPHALVGDMDSVEPVELARLRDAGIDIRQYSRDKDETDLELALNYALERDPPAILILGGLGARLDHTLGNLALLLDERLVGRECCLDDGVERVTLCRDQVELRGTPGDIVSLVPWGAPAQHVRTSGLRWSLNDETLLPERSRGISNVMLETTARIVIAAGLLLVVQRRSEGHSS
ncbi:MAG TPA: thiamine diphosphokinase [Anaerolineales bacterium]